MTDSVRSLACAMLASLALTACTSTQGPVAQAPSCLDQLDPAALTVTPDSGIIAPQPIHRQEPVVPGSLRSDVIATIEAVIAEDGTPRNICVASGDREWGMAMAQAFANWRFQPATKDGQPVAVRFTLTTRFRRN